MKMGRPRQVAEGSAAPRFALKDKNGELHRLSDKSHDFTLIFFYPKDDTPGCTVEAREFSKTLSNFSRMKTRLLGVSGGDEASKRMFCSKHKLKTILLSDPDYQVAQRYGAFGEKSFMGRKYQGILRKSFLVDKKLKIVKIFEQVDPRTHAKEVLVTLKSLKSVGENRQLPAERGSAAGKKTSRKSSRRTVKRQ